MIDNMKTIPKTYGRITKNSPLSGEMTAMAMTNWDGTYNENICNRLKKEKVFAQYSGWDFCGLVWFDKGKKRYFCEVWVHRSHVDTKDSETPQELMDAVSSEYGYE